MLEDSTDRELKAVDSEYKNALASDGWRYMYLRKSATHPAHPTSKFGTGNVTTLDTPNTRTALIDFHDKYYHASRMSLCVFTNGFNYFLFLSIPPTPVLAFPYSHLLFFYSLFPSIRISLFFLLHHFLAFTMILIF